MSAGETEAERERETEREEYLAANFVKYAVELLLEGGELARRLFGRQCRLRLAKKW